MSGAMRQMQRLLNRRRPFILLLLRALAVCAATLLALWAPLSTTAQDDARAGLVIVHGDGSVMTRCVSFDPPSLSGAELLVRSGIDLAMEAGAMGAAICRINGEGCNFPQEACFCQCEGTPCRYWSYWRLQEGAWVYSNLGAGNTTVRNGDVEGWRWGIGTAQTAEPPPLLTFEDICAPLNAELSEEQRHTSVDSAPTSDGDTGESKDPQAGDRQTDGGRTVLEAAEQSRTADDTVPSPAAAVGALLGALAALPLATLLFIWLRRGARRRHP